MIPPTDNMGNPCLTQSGGNVDGPGIIYSDGQSLTMAPDVCWAAGGYKWFDRANNVWQYSPNAPRDCGSMARCDGTQSGQVAVGGKICGKDNMEFLCIAGVWQGSPYECEPGAAGMCPTSCGEVLSCDGSKVATSKIGATVCGEKDGKYLTMTCGKDGKWSAGTDCTCMTICPDLKACDGSMKSKVMVGQSMCGDDRKTHKCEKNLIGPPSWTYGAACRCPGDPEPVVAPPPPAAAPPAAAAAATSSNTMLIAAGAFVFLFIMIMIVVLVFVMRRRRAGGEGTADEFKVAPELK